MKRELGIPACHILSTEIAVTNMDEIRQLLLSKPAALEGEYICVSNVHTTVTAFEDESYRAVQNGAALALPDGKPLSLVSRRRGFTEASRVAGPDLMETLFTDEAGRKLRHYFYGSTPQTLKALEEKLTERYPGICIAAMVSPPYYPTIEDIPKEEDEAAIRAIREADPDVIWVGLGAPKQERWMAAHKGLFRGVMIGVGAGFDFHAGTIRRAPRWMQETYLEWAYRILQDPKRLLPRYLSTNLRFIRETSREGREIKRAARNTGLPLRSVQEKAAERGKRPLHIAFIGHKRIPSREGGIEVVVDHLATGYALEGDRVTAYNRCDKKRRFHRTNYGDVEIIEVPTLHSHSFNAIIYAFLGSIKLLGSHADLAHYHAEGPCIMLWLPKLFGIPTVVTIHGLDWQRAKWGRFASAMLRFGERMAARHADELIVLSGNMQDYFRRTYGRESHFIPNGIDLPARRAPQLIREKYGLTENGYVLYLARLVPEKGVHYLIEAYKKVPGDRPLIFAGEDCSTPEYARQIRELAADDPRIRFIGFVEGQLLEELYSNCALYVLPSDVEGMALTLLEAMSYGRPCLVSDIPENTEVVGSAAALFKHGDVADLTRALAEVLADETRREELGKAALERAKSRYSWAEVEEKTHALYEELMVRKGRWMGYPGGHPKQ